MLNLTIREYGLSDTADIPVPRKSSDLNHHSHRDFAVKQNARSKVQVHTDVYELKINDWSACGPDKRRLKTSGCDRYLRADAD